MRKRTNYNFNTMHVHERREIPISKGENAEVLRANLMSAFGHWRERRNKPHVVVQTTILQGKLYYTRMPDRPV